MSQQSISQKSNENHCLTCVIITGANSGFLEGGLFDGVWCPNWVWEGVGVGGCVWVCVGMGGCGCGRVCDTELNQMQYSFP